MKTLTRDEDDPQTYAIIGAEIEVHRHLGHGFLEAVYQAALARELVKRSIPFRREVGLPVWYHGETLEVEYRADFVCFDEVLVELKALSGLSAIHDAQVINYLKACRCERALLFNFGAPRLQHKRFILTKTVPISEP